MLDDNTLLRETAGYPLIIICNQGVTGSNPVAGTNKIKGLRLSFFKPNCRGDTGVTKSVLALLTPPPLVASMFPAIGV